MNNPKISIIIPVYNPGEHLLKCLNSFVNQTYQNLEIVLIVDGSIDESDAVCDRYACKDSRITVVHKKNSGVSQARNNGLEIVTGDYYYFPDSDDYVELDSFEFLLRVIDEYQCDAVVFEHYVTYPDREECHKLPKEYYGLYEGREEIIKIYFRISFTCNKLFSKELITGKGEGYEIRFNETISRGEDSIFSRTVLDNADRVFFSERPLYHYVQSEGSACRGVFRTSQLSLLDTIDLNYKWFSERYPEYLPILYSSALGSFVMLYYDMWSDENDYHDECKKLYDRFNTEYNDHINVMKLSMKQIMKYQLFKLSPVLFCYLHRINESISKYL